MLDRIQAIGNGYQQLFLEITGAVSYVVFLADDSTMRRHIDQLRPRTSKEDNDIDDQGPNCTHSPVFEPSRTTSPFQVSPPVATPPVPIIRRSSRNRRPVDHYAPVMSP